jgi:hypothetical protein
LRNHYLEIRIRNWKIIKKIIKFFKEKSKKSLQLLKRKNNNNLEVFRIVLDEYFKLLVPRKPFIKIQEIKKVW